LAWLPSSLLILLYLLSTPKRAGQAASEIPLFSAEKPGPFGTIAKVCGERKEKTAKKAEKMQVFCEAVEKTCVKGGYARIHPIRTPREVGLPRIGSI
jgi:hypothetical protein